LRKIDVRFTGARIVDEIRYGILNALFQRGEDVD
jgi:hypothetical protein